MPKPITNIDVAAYLTKLYVDAASGKEPDPLVAHIKSMIGRMNDDAEKLNPQPFDFQLLKLGYEKLDKQLTETATRIRNGNVDPKELLKQQKVIQNSVAAIANNTNSVLEKINDPEAVDHEEDKEIFEGYDLHKFLEIKPKEADMQQILKMSGETKSAYKWIDSVYDKMESRQNVTEKNVALILAARQLGNAVYDHPENIKKAQISEGELNAHAARLMHTKEFQDYYKDVVGNLDFKKTIKHGHGGYLEKTFEDYLVKQKVRGPLHFDVNGRYQKTLDAEMAKRRDIDYSSYQTYKDYFEQNKGNVQLNPTVHAARMAAADALDKENPGAVFKKGNLDRKAIAIMQDPSFRILTALPGKQEMLLNGDGPGFEASVQEVKETCKSMLDKDGKFAHKDHSDIALNRLKNRVEAGEDVNSDLKDVVNSIESLKSGDKKTPRDVINTVGKIMEYQEKHMAEDTMGDKGRDMNDTLRVLHELTAGTKLNDVVQTQIDKVNSVRNVVPEQKNYLTKDFIAKEGVDAEKAAKGPAAGVPQA